MDRRTIASQFSGGGSGGTATPVDKRAVRRQEQSDRQMARSYNKAELRLMDQYGATPEEIQAEKVANRTGLQANRETQRGDGYQAWDGGLLSTANTYAGKDYESKVGEVLGGVEDTYDKYGLPGYHIKHGKDSEMTITGFRPDQIAEHLANPDSTKFPGMGKMLDTIEAIDGKAMTAEELAQYGKVKEKANGVVKMKVDNQGKDHFSTVYFSKNADGTYSSSGYDRYHYQSPKVKGGFFSSGLGQIAMIAASIWAGPALSTAFGGGIGGGMAAGATLGGAQAAITGGDIGKGILLGGLGGAANGFLSGLEGGSNFVGPANPATAAQNAAIQVGGKAAIGGVTAALGGGDVGRGLAGGAVGGAVDQVMPSTSLLGTVANQGTKYVAGSLLNDAFSQDQQVTQSSGGSNSKVSWSPMNGDLATGGRRAIASQFGAR